MDVQSWEIRETVSFVAQHGYKRVALQFPDELLADAPLVAAKLAEELSSLGDVKVYILADTSYNSSGVDEVAAQHVQADCVVGGRWRTMIMVPVAGRGTPPPLLAPQPAAGLAHTAACRTADATCCS
jgi:hypothetical protein